MPGNLHRNLIASIKLAWYYSQWFVACTSTQDTIHAAPSSCTYGSYAQPHPARTGGCARLRLAVPSARAGALPAAGHLSCNHLGEDTAGCARRSADLPGLAAGALHAPSA